MVRFKEIYDCSHDGGSIIEFMQFGNPLDQWTLDSPISDTFYELFFPVEESGWEVEIEGRPSLNMQLKMVPSRDGSMDRSDCMVGAAIPVIPEVVAAPPGILLPNVFAPFKRHF